MLRELQSVNEGLRGVNKSLNTLANCFDEFLRMTGQILGGNQWVFLFSYLNPAV